MANNFTEEYVAINGIEQYFLHMPGDGQDVLIMLHGGPGLANSYLAYYQQPYAGFCNVVYYDQRGAGKTQIRNKSAAESLTFEALLEDLRRTVEYVRRKYGTDRIFLVGHSWGTVLGTQYVLNYPGDVAGYIGYGQVVCGAKQDRFYYEFVKDAVMKSGDAQQITAIGQVRESFPDVPREEYFAQYSIVAGLGFGHGYDFTARDVFEIYMGSPTWGEEDALAAESIEKLNEGLYAQALFGWSVLDVRDYAVPMYYILGRHDQMTSSAIASEYFERINAPAKGLYWIEDAGHLLDTDNPEAFFGAVREVLRAGFQTRPSAVSRRT
ncbi:MAG: alpha/beta hydrolase [Defluviitaleaceae bacterium]|nr:alpha/beta hydrolase [Defluviitaleaceae bacterium]